MLTPLFVLIYFTRVLLGRYVHLDPHSLLPLAKVKSTTRRDTIIDSHSLATTYLTHVPNVVQRIVLG